jgi:two-component sensor histidine kinase
LPHRRLIRRINDTSIGVQLAVLLTIAIIPIGLIAISQATSALRETKELADTALIGRVTQAAKEEIELFSDAQATARALGYQILDDNNLVRADCEIQLRRFVDNYEFYLFAGFINKDGMMTCSSTGDTRDYSQSPVTSRLLVDPVETIRVVEETTITKRSAIVATQPIFRDGELQGLLSVSIPIEVLRLEARSGDEAFLYHVALIDQTGDVFASNTPLNLPEDWLPEDVNLHSMESAEGRTFEANSIAGDYRTYALTPIFSDQIFALATRVRDDPAGVTGARYLSVYLFPVAMWGIGLLVSLLAVHQLVIRHITSLRDKIHAFDSGERNIEDLALSKAPGELADLGESFSRMIATITHDEFIQAEALKEKNVLLREVYHRVKNNLQLILSIMNMQSRNISSPVARQELAKLQNRVMSIATIHQMLYSVPELSSVQAQGFVDEIVRNIVSAGWSGGNISLEMNIEPIMLNPDVAVPLSLYVSEAITNAMKHALTGRKEGEISVSLTKDGNKGVLRVVNSVAPMPEDTEQMPSGGLGSRLMGAFADQLGGVEERFDRGDEYEVVLTFNPGIEPEPDVESDTLGETE